MKFRWPWKKKDASPSTPIGVDGWKLTIEEKGGNKWWYSAVDKEMFDEAIDWFLNHKDEPYLHMNGAAGWERIHVREQIVHIALDKTKI